MSQLDISGYRYSGSALSSSHGYLLPGVFRILDGLGLPADKKRLFELGCGNGSVAGQLSQSGWEVTGVDPSTEGISQARQHYPHIGLAVGSAYDDLSDQYGQFPVVLSLEVVEHVYAPRQYARTLFDLVACGGTAIVSTPYHGYWKNLALAISGQMDKHFTALWDNGHIKFWSKATLGELLREVGFSKVQWVSVGRVPAFSKSMIAIARKP